MIDNSKLPITSIEALGITGTPPDVDITTYVFSVTGLVYTPLTLTYSDLLKYPTVTELLLLTCRGLFADNAEWTGVPVSTFLTQAGIKPEATQVIIHAIDGYSQTFSLDEVQRDGVFLAFMVNGQTLPKEHGYPLRLVVRGRWGSFWAKWVDGLELSNSHPDEFLPLPFS
jgi:DMSO/TMAO reductase YedYZ molybdopterin-dependent catalytic subunit